MTSSLAAKALEVFRDEYARNFPPGGDAQDHHEAQRAAMEAVVTAFYVSPIVDVNHVQACALADLVRTLDATDTQLSTTRNGNLYAVASDDRGGAPSCRAVITTDGKVRTDYSTAA